MLGRRGRLLWPGGLVWPVVAGVVLIATGIGLRAWSIATLGRLVLAGIALACGDIWSLAAVAVLGRTGLAVRIRAEERQRIP